MSKPHSKNPGFACKKFELGLFFVSLSRCRKIKRLSIRLYTLATILARQTINLKSNICEGLSDSRFSRENLYAKASNDYSDHNMIDEAYNRLSFPLW